MKFVTMGIAAVLLFAVSDAYAVVCARGVARAGCATTGRAPVVVAPRRPVVVTPHPHPRCAMVNGRRVCR